MNETTFADVSAYLNNRANELTARERASQKRESARLDQLRTEWLKANSKPADWDMFAEFY
jgi:hypothetical protein